MWKDCWAVQLTGCICAGLLFSSMKFCDSCFPVLSLSTFTLEDVMPSWLTDVSSSYKVCLYPWQYSLFQILFWYWHSRLGLTFLYLSYPPSLSPLHKVSSGHWYILLFIQPDSACFFTLLRTESGAFYILGQHYITELHPNPLLWMSAILLLHPNPKAS